MKEALPWILILAVVLVILAFLAWTGHDKWEPLP